MLTIMHHYGKTIVEVKEKLESDFDLVTTWFHDNRVLLNPGKCHYLRLNSKPKRLSFPLIRECLEIANMKLFLELL